MTTHHPKPLRLFVDAHLLDRGFEGAASFIVGLYTELLRAYPGRYRVFLGCRDPGKALSMLPDLPGLDAVKYTSNNRFARLLYDTPFAITRIRADVAHFQYFTPLVKNSKWIVTLHDVLFNDFPDYFPPGYARSRNILFPLSAKRADLLTTVSNYSRERIAHWYGIDPQRISVVPNGVEVSQSESHTFSDPRLADLAAEPGGYLLCVSRFEPRKNQRLLLEAYGAARLWEGGVKLVFVGSRTMPCAQFDATLNELPSLGRASVHFLVGVSQEDLGLLYSRAIAAVYPSYAEGFGIPPLEAAARGTPSLCAGVTAMRDLDVLNASFFDPNDREGLLKLLLPIIADPIAARAQARRVAKDLAERHSWASAAKMFHGLLTATFGQSTFAASDRRSL